MGNAENLINAAVFNRINTVGLVWELLAPKISLLLVQIDEEVTVTLDQNKMYVD